MCHQNPHGLSEPNTANFLDHYRPDRSSKRLLLVAFSVHHRMNIIESKGSRIKNVKSNLQNFFALVIKNIRHRYIGRAEYKMPSLAKSFSSLMANSNLLSTGLADEDQTAAESSHLLYQCLQTPVTNLPVIATHNHMTFYILSIKSSVQFIHCVHEKTPSP